MLTEESAHDLVDLWNGVHRSSEAVEKLRSGRTTLAMIVKSGARGNMMSDLEPGAV